MCEIRLLEPSDIEVRAQQVNDKGAVLLLYKNARVDMAILDEKFGMFGCQREHFFKDGKNYCRVSIWDNQNKQWVTKEDIGTESNTEKEKGEASDAFKRACVNIGIGRELYTAPFIWVALEKNERSQNERSNKWQLVPGVGFEVSEIKYDDRRNISALAIADRNGNERFRWPRSRRAPRPIPSPMPQQAPAKAKNRITMDMIEDKTKCNKLLERIYGFYINDGYPPEWDAGARLLKSYDADAEVVDRFSELFESYRQARLNIK